MAVFRPQDFGAVPWGDALFPAQDARPGIQAAINAAVAAGGGDVDLGPYRWLVSRSPAGSYNRFAALSCHGSNVRVFGAGKLQTTIMATGDAGAATFNILQLDPGACNVVLEGFTIDTTGLTNTDAGEQTHAIVIGSGVCTASNGTDHMPVRDIVVRDVRFLHAGPPGERWGDAIRVGGNTELTAVVNCKLVGLDFMLCGRSGVTIQRNVKNLLIQGCYFDADHIGGTAIDGEATGGGWDAGLVVNANQIVRTLPGGDNFAISMTSQTNFAITNNVLIGRGIALVRGTDGVIANNSIDATDQQAQSGTIAVDNMTRDVVISGNTVRRRGLGGPVLKIQPHAGVFPGDLVVNGNAITNETEGAAVMLVSPRDTVISGNKFTCNGAPGSMGIYVDAGTRVVEGLAITGNVFRGAAYAPVRLSASASQGRGFNGAVITGNVSRASGPGIRADNTQFNMNVVTGFNSWSATPMYAP